MKKILLCGAAFLLMMSGMANASLTVIGTATYNGETCNLIWDDNNNDNSVVWLDYSNYDYWDNLMTWAAGLASELEDNITLYGGYSVDWDDDGWRLPGMGGGDTTTTEFGHLIYEELGNELKNWSTGEGGTLNNTGDFSSLVENDWYWYSWEASETEAYGIWIPSSMQMTKDKDGGSWATPSYGIALITAEVSAVPVPAAVWLLASGLIGLVGIRRRGNQ